MYCYSLSKRRVIQESGWGWGQRVQERVGENIRNFGNLKQTITTKYNVNVDGGMEGINDNGSYQKKGARTLKILMILEFFKHENLHKDYLNLSELANCF